MPQIGFPPFEIVHHNHTMSFGEICSELGSGIIVVPLVAVLANVAIAKAFSKFDLLLYLSKDSWLIIRCFVLCIIASGQAVDASQEMLTLGLCNIVGSCVKSMPICGAFTRSAVSNASGVKTPMAGLYVSVMAVLALSLLTPYFYYIPVATLASVLVIAVMFMVG